MPGGSLGPWLGGGHPGHCGGTHWGQTWIRGASSGLQPHHSLLARTAPLHHKNSGKSPGWQFLTQGAGDATGGWPQAHPGDMDLVCAVSHSTGLLPGQLLWPRGQHPEMPQTLPQSRYLVAWPPPWHCWPPPSASSMIQPTYGPFSMDTKTVLKGKSGTNSTAAWPTALLVPTQRIYI